MTENSILDCYLVGGAVRDQLLGLTPVERDWVVVGSNTERMESLGFRIVGKEFPVFLHPTSKEEYALARTERKNAPGHTGFEIQADASITLEEDLLRRDLTINSIAKNDNGEIIDPFKGQDDLTNRILRHTSTAFSEDPLRVLRVARFMAQLSPYNFTIAEPTLGLMKKLTNSGELDKLSAERIWTETEKALMTVKPSLYFQTLRECGALTLIFPEVDALFGIPQRPEYHPEIDSGIHTMMVVDRAAELTKDLSVRFAALTHDLGKALTPPSQWPSHVGHEKRGLTPLKQLTDKYPVQKKLKKVAELCCQHHLLMHRLFELRPETILTLLEQLDGFRNPQRIEQFTLLCKADAEGRGGGSGKPYPQSAFLKSIYSEIASITMSDIESSVLSGPEIGREIRNLRIAKISHLKERYQS